jgi:hypothetical protein
MPLRPFDNDDHVSAAELPHGVTAPIPVIATRRLIEGTVFMKRRDKTGILSL